MVKLQPEEGVVEQKLYKGKVIVKFFGPTPEKPSRHIYTANSDRKIGVTTYLGIKDKSRALVIWATELARDYLLSLKEITPEEIETACKLHAVRKQEAADLGNLAHDWIEQYIKGNKPEMPEDSRVVIAVNGVLDWVKEHKVKFISSERVVYSKKHDYIGTLDAEAIVDGERAVVDFKTSGGLYNPVRMQTAAYQMADEEAGTKAYKGRWAIRVAKETEDDYLAKMSKKGKIDFAPYVAFEAKFFDQESLADDFRAFLACKTLFDWDKRTDFYLNK